MAGKKRAKGSGQRLGWSGRRDERKLNVAQTNEHLEEDLAAEGSSWASCTLGNETEAIAVS